MNTLNDQENAEDFEKLYLAYKAKYEAAERNMKEIAHHLRRCTDPNDPRIVYCSSIANKYERINVISY